MIALKVLAIGMLAVGTSSAASSSQGRSQRDAAPTDSAVVTPVVDVEETPEARALMEREANEANPVVLDSVAASAPAWFPDPPVDPVCCQSSLVCEVYTKSCPCGSVAVPCPCLPDQ